MERNLTFLETLAIEHDKSIARQLAEERQRRHHDLQLKGATFEETMGSVWDRFHGSDPAMNLVRPPAIVRRSQIAAPMERAIPAENEARPPLEIRAPEPDPAELENEAMGAMIEARIKNMLGPLGDWDAFVRLINELIGQDKPTPSRAPRRRGGGGGGLAPFRPKRGPGMFPGQEDLPVN